MQVNRIEAGRKGGVREALLMAEIMAFQGRYQEAARLYTTVRTCMCCPWHNRHMHRMFSV